MIKNYNYMRCLIITIVVCKKCFSHKLSMVSAWIRKFELLFVT